MTKSKEYQTADAFKRLLMREIASGNKLIKAGWGKEPLPADIHTLESVKKWFDKYVERERRNKGK